MKVDKTKWKKAILSEITHITMGQSPDSSSYNKDALGLPFYQGNADFGKIHPTPRIYCNAPTRIAKENALLISVRAPIGAINIANELCCIGRGLAAIQMIDKKSHLHFIKYVLKAANNELNRQGTGMTFKAINKKVLFNLIVLLPEFGIQHAIASELDAIQTMIDGYKAQLDDLDAFAKSIFLDMFGDPAANPKGWKIYLFSDIADSQLGKMINQRTQQGELKPFLCAVNILDNNFLIDEIKQFAIKDDERDKYRVIKGDLLICEGGDAGRCAIWNKDIEIYYQKTLHRVRSSKLSVLYLMFILRFYKKQGLLTEKLNGLTIQHLTQKSLSQIPIPVPPIEMQQQFANRIEAIEQQKEQIRLQLKDAETLMAERMQYYFS